MKNITLFTNSLVVFALCFAFHAAAQDEIPAGQPTPAVPIATATADETPIATPAKESPGPEDNAVRPLSATVHLVSGTKLEGTLLTATELIMKTSFGEVNIPLNEVAGIRLAEQGNGTTTVILHNGDSITGGTQLSKLDIVTEWGQAEVNGDNISSILFTQGLRWENATVFTGTRWTLVENADGTSSKTSVVRPANTASSASLQPTTGTRSVRTFGSR